MKKIIALLMITSCIVFFAEAKKTNDDSVNEDKVSETVDKAGEGIKKGVDAAGKGIKELFGKAKEKADEEDTKETKEKIKETGKKVGDKVKSGAEKTKEVIETHEVKNLTGTLKVKGFGKKVFSFKADDGKTYTLKTISGSEDSNLKLSAYNKKKVKITGILNTETNEITLTTYKLAGE